MGLEWELPPLRIPAPPIPQPRYAERLFVSCRRSGSAPGIFLARDVDKVPRGDSSSSPPFPESRYQGVGSIVTKRNIIIKSRPGPHVGFTSPRSHLTSLSPSVYLSFALGSCQPLSLFIYILLVQNVSIRPAERCSHTSSSQRCPFPRYPPEAERPPRQLRLCDRGRRCGRPYSG